MGKQTRKGATAAEGQFLWNWQQQADRDKKEKCLNLPPKVSINSFHLDDVQVNLLPLADSAYKVKRRVGVSVVCAERRDTPQQVGSNPASAYFC